MPKLISRQCVANRLEKWCSLVGKKAAWLYLLVVLVIVWDVITRRLLDRGSVLLQELEWHVHSVVFLACLAWTYGRDEHIRLDLLRPFMSTRLKAQIELWGCLLLLLPWSIWTTVWGWQFVAASFNIGERSNAPSGLGARWLIKSALPLGMMLLTLQGWAQVLRLLTLLFPRLATAPPNMSVSQQPSSFDR